MSLWDDLEAAIRATEQARKEETNLRAEIVKEYCPIKVGEVIDCQGYVHKGKKVKVTNITLVPSWKRNSYKWSIRGIVLKKDGSESSFRTDFRVRV